MKCDFCDQKATVFLTKLVDNEMQKMCLCETCAEERGVTDPIGLSVGESDMGNFKMPTPQALGEDVACSTCGFTLAHLRKVGRLGCAECYHVFASEIRQVLSGMHKGMKHQGRVPEGLAAQHEMRRKLGELQEQLEKAISDEAFEQAAVLKEKIEALKTEELV